MSTFPLPTPQSARETADKIRTQSRQRYGMDKNSLENMIKDWSTKSFSKVEKVMEQAKSEAKKSGSQKSSQSTNPQ